MTAEITVQCRSLVSELPPRHQRQSALDYGNGLSTTTTSSSPSAVPDTNNRRRTVSNDNEALPVSTATVAMGSPRRSWEESFQSLSRDLRLICGSNSSVDEMTSPSGGGGAGDSGNRQTSPVTGTTTAVMSNGHGQPHPSIHRSYTATVSSTPASKALGGVTASSRPVPVLGNHKILPAAGAIDGGSSSPLSRCPVVQQLFGGYNGDVGSNRNCFPFPPTAGNAGFAAGRFPPLLGCSPGAVAAVSVRPGWRPVRVHHEETTDRLRQSLTKICLQHSSNNSSASASPCTSTSDGLNQDVTFTSGDLTTADVPVSQRRPDDSSSAAAGTATDAKSRQLRLKESLKSGVRVRLDLVEVGCDPNYVIVAVRTDGSGNKGDRFLTVWNASATTSTTQEADGVVRTKEQPLVSVKLPAQTRVSALACHVTEARVLYVRERSKDAMYVEVDPPNSELFLPVLQEDESQLTVSVMLHVADHFHFEDLAVRTIDDRLVIKGRRGLGVPSSPHGSSAGEDDQSPDLDSAATYISGTFTVMLALPEGTYTRTVRAAFASREHQLVVTAALAPASRRMTCAF